MLAVRTRLFWVEGGRQCQVVLRRQAPEACSLLLSWASPTPSVIKEWKLRVKVEGWGGSR